jgi:MoxR-like ATPase
MRDPSAGIIPPAGARAPAPGRPERIYDAPDPRDGRVYVMSGDIDLAIRVTLAPGRPLLLRGDPGTGKSSLAAYIAQQRGWRYYEHVVTSRTQARDLLWTFDSVRRLADAQVRGSGTELNNYDYVEPGVLWWALACDSACRRGAPDGVKLASDAVEPDASTNAKRSKDHAVVLIDEIDKADPDMPNGLLVPLGSNEFIVSETGTVIGPGRMGQAGSGGRRIVIITTNEERALPQAFLRRCVVLWLEHPGKDRLVEIAQAHLKTYEGAYTQADKSLAEALATELISLRTTATRQALRAPSTAEFLDALRACRSLGISVGSDDWERLRDLTLIKPQQPGQ